MPEIINFKTIEKRLSLYESLQKRHLDMLRTQDLPDLKAMTDERADIFSDLKSSLNQYARHANTIKQDELSGLVNIKERLNFITAVDEKIAFEVNRHKGDLLKTLTKLKQGKKTMAGYSSMAGTKNNPPRVLSMKR